MSLGRVMLAGAEAAIRRPKNFRRCIVSDCLGPAQVRPLLCHRLNNHPPSCSSVTKRFKRRERSQQDNDENSDNEEELHDENPLLVDDDSQPLEGSREREIEISSLRFDAFAKSAFNIPRAKVEERFYKGEFYINGEKPPKKSFDVSLSDEVDLVKGINPEDHTLIDIKRVQVIGLADKTTSQGRVKVKIAVWEDLTIKPHGEADD